MHMADALLSPAVGGTMWAATAGTIAYCSARVRSQLDDRKVPLMGVLGAFIFAAQMINFTIPATGSSGHLGGGLLLAILLGPHAAFLVIASVLFVQALFFADGGLLALGCNIINLGLLPAFVAYPLVYRKLAGREPGQTRLMVAAIVAGVLGLQLGAFGVVAETTLSGISSLPFETFLLLMQPIHLAIGVVEGVVTAAVVSFVWRARPEILLGAESGRPLGTVPLRSVLVTFLLVALVTGGVLSWFASAHPDGLEWAIAKVTGTAELPEGGHGISQALLALQETFSFLPDYGFKAAADGSGGEAGGAADRLGTSVSGLVGGAITLAVCVLIGLLLRRRTRRVRPG